MQVFVINGPNLNMLGSRESSHYGVFTYSDLNKILTNEANGLGVDLSIVQFNSEGDIVSYIQDVPKDSGIIINAGAYTHTSIAIRDALIGRRFVEVHISNVFSREDFRHISYLSDIAIGVIAGFGVQSYLLALKYMTTI